MTTSGASNTSFSLAVAEAEKRDVLEDDPDRIPPLSPPAPPGRGDASVASASLEVAKPERRSLSFDGPLLGVNLSAILMVYLVNFMDSLGGNISTPILPFYGKEFGATTEQVGQLFSVFALTQTLAMPILGLLSDRYGRRTVILWSLCGCALGAVCQGLATSFNQLFAARAFSGIWAGVGSVCQVYIADVVPPEMRVEYLGYLLSSTQASILFGPSLGAGLSALGLNVPILVQSAVSLFLLPLVCAYLPESPEWLKQHAPQLVTPFCSPDVMGKKKKEKGIKTQNPGLGVWGTGVTIALFGVVAWCSMIAQMSIISMFAIFAKQYYGLDSLRVGFAMTLGAIASIGTNIWVAPFAQRRLGNQFTSMLGSLLIAVGATCTVAGFYVSDGQPLYTSLGSLMVTYVGIAINGGAVATGTANLTDMQNRSKVMLSVRMLKSFGAMSGPIISGHFADIDVRLPFIIAASFAVLGGTWQLLGVRSHNQIQNLIKGRKAVCLDTPLLFGEGWQDEFGTPEEIRDLGEYVANLLSTRHYRWVTYNTALKNYLSDAFPLLPVESEEAYKEAYDNQRSAIKQFSSWECDMLMRGDSAGAGDMFSGFCVSRGLSD